jgi:hypothetical protein
MLKNSNSDSDREVGHTCSGRTFKEVPLVNLFDHSHKPLAQDEGFYSGEEEYLLNEEESGSVGKRTRRLKNLAEKNKKIQELCRLSK